METAAAENEGWVEPKDEIPQLDLSEEEIESIDPDGEEERDFLIEEPEVDWYGEGITMQ